MYSSLQLISDIVDMRNRLRRNFNNRTSVEIWGMRQIGDLLRDTAMAADSRLSRRNDKETH